MNKIKTLVKKLKFLGEKKNMPKVALAIVVIFIAGVMIFGGKQSEKLEGPTVIFQNNNGQAADIIYYYGQECSHCKVVDKFIADNKVDERITFDKKEVWHNIDNSNEFQEKAKECALDSNSVGVPFLYARGKCYVGETDVQAFLKNEAVIQ
jgi:glutaredoxin